MNKLMRKVAVAVAVFMIVVAALAVFGWIVLGLSAAKMAIEQMGLPAWPVLVFVALTAIACAVGGE